ncbi:hypothetical protein CAP48_12370 [Advenella sp. S44]|nr:hypothetical protein CAP48_12370 [Advenella sp. S44]
MYLGIVLPKSCSLAARGLWHEMMCLMHESEPYGHMAVNGKPMKRVMTMALRCLSSQPNHEQLCEK